MDNDAAKPRARDQVKGITVPLTQSQLEAIGRVAALWSWAQNLLEHLFWVLVPTDQQTGQILTTHLSDEARCNIIKLLGARFGDPYSTEINNLLDEFDELRRDRNEVIHNHWAGTEAEMAQGYKPSARGSFKLNPSLWTEADMKALAEDIEDWSIRVSNYMNDDLSWPAPQSIFLPLFLAALYLRNRNNQQATEGVQQQVEPSPE